MAPTDRIPLLLDTDIGSDIDDAICLSYLLGEPRCEVLGITTVSGRPRERAALVDAVCRAAGRDDVPVHAGTEHALLGGTPQPEVPQASVLDRFAHRAPGSFEPNTAVTFLRDAILDAPGAVTLLTIGPMTNAALLFATYPETAAKLRALVIMGGAYSTSRWIGGGQEWNSYCDPAAAKIVYHTPVAQHRSVGLNTTTQCVLPTSESIARFEALGGPWSVVAAMTEVWGERAESVTYHDPLAAVAVVDPDVCTWAGGRVSIELASKRLQGTTSFDRDRDGSPHEVAVDVDVDRFFTRLFAR